VSNLFRIPEAERLAERLCAATFADLVFFCNSGAEAMECAIKVARKYQFVSGRPERHRFITFEGAFHGRTLATLAAGGQKKYLEGFGPVVPGFDQVPFGDFEAVKTAIGPETAAIVIEPMRRTLEIPGCARSQPSATSASAALRASSGTCNQLGPADSGAPRSISAYPVDQSGWGRIAFGRAPER